MNMLFTHKLSTFVRRAIYVMGWVILASDATDISFQIQSDCTTLSHTGRINYGG